VRACKPQVESFPDARREILIYSNHSQPPCEPADRTDLGGPPLASGDALVGGVGSTWSVSPSTEWTRTRWPTPTATWERACQVSPPILTRPRGAQAATTVALAPIKLLDPTTGEARCDHHRPYTVPAISHSNAAASPTPFHGYGKTKNNARPMAIGSTPPLYLKGLVAANQPRRHEANRPGQREHTTVASAMVLEAANRKRAHPPTGPHAYVRECAGERVHARLPP
jgi:hypothetical protein